MRKSLILVVVLWLTACSPRVEKLCGVYQGVLPAADTPGIEVTLTFGQNNQVTQRLVYIGKKGGVFTDKGSFSEDGNIIGVMISEEDTSYYRLEQGQLRRLNIDMQPVEGPLADYYILKKVKYCR